MWEEKSNVLYGVYHKSASAIFMAPKRARFYPTLCQALAFRGRPVRDVGQSPQAITNNFEGGGRETNMVEMLYRAGKDIGF